MFYAFRFVKIVNFILSSYILHDFAISHKGEKGIPYYIQMLDFLPTRRAFYSVLQSIFCCILFKHEQLVNN